MLGLGLEPLPEGVALRVAILSCRQLNVDAQALLEQLPGEECNHALNDHRYVEVDLFQPQLTGLDLHADRVIKGFRLYLAFSAQLGSSMMPLKDDLGVFPMVQTQSFLSSLHEQKSSGKKDQIDDHLCMSFLPASSPQLMEHDCYVGLAVRL